MCINSIFLEWGIDIQNDIDFFEYLTSTYPQHCYYIDRFPMLIKSFEKYEQEEVYFKKVINQEESNKLFFMEELKFINVMKKLWLYNQVFVHSNLLELSDDEIIAVLNENNSNIITLKKFMKNSNNDTIILEKVRHLELLIKLSVRESLYSKILFLDKKILIIAHGMCFQVYMHDLSSLEFLKTVVNTEGLYLRPYECE